MVWRLATLSVPRLYIIRARAAYSVCPHTLRPMFSIIPCQEVKERTRRLLALFLTCKNAQKEARRTLPPRLKIASSPDVNGRSRLGQLHFDVETDVLCLNQPRRPFQERVSIPEVGGDFLRIKNLGLQLDIPMSPNVLWHLRSWAVQLEFFRLLWFRLFFSATRFYLVAPPHIRNAPKPLNYTGHVLEESHGDTVAEGSNTEDDRVEVGYMSSGPMWSNNPLLRSLQMTVNPGSFGRTGGFGFPSVPVQQVQHVHVTDRCEDLTPTRLSLWLSALCEPEADDFVRAMIQNLSHMTMVSLWMHRMTGVHPNQGSTMRYCGILLPMAEAYPLLKVYEG